MFQGKSVYTNWTKKVSILADKAQIDPSGFTTEDADTLNRIDSHLTEIMLTGERLC